MNRWSLARPSSPRGPARRPLKAYFEPISPDWSSYRGLYGTFDRPLLAVAFAVRIWHRSAVAGDNKATISKGCGCSSGVEHDLAKVGVEGSNPFARSSFSLLRELRAMGVAASGQLPDSVSAGCFKPQQTASHPLGAGSRFHHRHLVPRHLVTATFRPAGLQRTATRRATGATRAFPFSATFRQRARIYLAYTREANVPRTSLYRAMW